jgi:hypothetical protein
MKTSDLDVGSIIGEKQNRAVVLVVWVQNLGAGEAIPPCLSVTVDETFAVDLNISVTLSEIAFSMIDSGLTFHPRS